jgi:hypothetical protein
MLCPSVSDEVSVHILVMLDKFYYNFIWNSPPEVVGQFQFPAILIHNKTWFT